MNEPDDKILLDRRTIYQALTNKNQYLYDLRVLVAAFQDLNDLLGLQTMIGSGDMSGIMMKIPGILSKIRRNSDKFKRLTNDVLIILNKPEYK